MARPIRIAIIGTLPPPIGGTSVLLQTLVDELRNRDDAQLIIINTSGIRGRGLRGLMQYASTVRRIGRAAREADVLTLHAATSGLHIIGPTVCLAARIFGKPVVLRKFGGADFLEYPFFRRHIIRWTVRRADLYMAETKMLVQSAQDDGISHVRWYPNNRPLLGEENPRSPAKSCRRFVFLSHVRPGKGVRELIKAGEHLDDGATVDVYGPFYDGMSESDFAGLKTVRYLGVVPPPEVVRTLEQYDALLLPTYHAGEGYPGIVLEAYRAGLPVVTTRWRAVPEIVDESCGILIEPQKADQLREAMNRLMRDDGLYARLCAGVLAKRRMFDSRVWSDKFLEYCRELASLPESMAS